MEGGGRRGGMETGGRGSRWREEEGGVGWKLEGEDLDGGRRKGQEEARN